MCHLVIIIHEVEVSLFNLVKDLYEYLAMLINNRNRQKHYFILLTFIANRSSIHSAAEYFNVN